MLECRSPQVQVAFWDVDAPATLQRVEGDAHDAFRECIPQYDFIFTYGGGDEVVERYRRLGARCCHPIYNALDPETHHREAADAELACDLVFVGNRLPDRERRVEEFFLRAAELAPEMRFVLGGEGWGGKALPPNVRWIGHVGTGAHNRINASARMALNINRDSMADVGFSPPTRVFEAAGAATCLITDKWRGVEKFFEPGREILVAESAEEIVGYLRGTSGGRGARDGRCDASAGAGRTHVCAARRRGGRDFACGAQRVREGTGGGVGAHGPGPELKRGKRIADCHLRIVHLVFVGQWARDYVSRAGACAACARTPRCVLREGRGVVCVESRSARAGLLRVEAVYELEGCAAVGAARTGLGRRGDGGLVFSRWNCGGDGDAGFGGGGAHVLRHRYADYGGCAARARSERLPARRSDWRRWMCTSALRAGRCSEELQRRFGVRRAVPLYCSFDPERYRAYPPSKRFACAMSYMGTYAPDRQPKLEEYLFGAARALPEMRFTVAGPQYPKDVPWPRNVRHIVHLNPRWHPHLYSSSRLTLNITRRDMVMAGYSPSVRLFEAAACGAAIASDNWPGLDRFFVPGREILLPASAEEMVRYLREVDERELRAIGHGGTGASAGGAHQPAARAGV